MTNFIAEIGSNHNGNFDRAISIIWEAAKIGCWAVKLQFIHGSLYAPGFSSPTLRIPTAWLEPLSREAHNRGLKFGCSVFDPKGADIAAPHCDFLKISSYSMLDMRLRDAVAKAGRPIILSTGMASEDEICRWDDVADTWLHCVSRYPCPSDKAGLERINRLRQIMFSARFSIKDVGYSDHTAVPNVVIRATMEWGASPVECHLDLDRTGAEWGGGHCWLPDKLGNVIGCVNEGEAYNAYDRGADASEKPWRADPSDGLRPMKEKR